VKQGGAEDVYVVEHVVVTGFDPEHPFKDLNGRLESPLVAFVASTEQRARRWCNRNLNYEEVRDGEFWYFRITRRTVDRDVWHDPRASELVSGVDWDGQDLPVVTGIDEGIRRVRISADGVREEIDPGVVIDDEETLPRELSVGHWLPIFEAGRCANCDAAVSLASPLYCSELCSQTAKTIRYIRNKIADGRADDPDVWEAVEMKIASVLGGGYPAKARQVPDQLRRTTMERDNFTCRLCGATATEIDHIAGSSNDANNLRALCKPCNMRLAHAKFQPTDAAGTANAAEIWRRIDAETPERLCDDGGSWSGLWRKLKGQALDAIA
jgi:hypothetical protein